MDIFKIFKNNKLDAETKNIAKQNPTLKECLETFCLAVRENSYVEKDHNLGFVDPTNLIIVKKLKNTHLIIQEYEYLKLSLAWIEKILKKQIADIPKEEMLAINSFPKRNALECKFYYHCTVLYIISLPTMLRMGNDLELKKYDEENLKYGIKSKIYSENYMRADIFLYQSAVENHLKSIKYITEKINPDYSLKYFPTLDEIIYYIKYLEA